eukprot:1161471-Pelagomonas_calceolata.AAC.10
MGKRELRDYAFHLLAGSTGPIGACNNTGNEDVMHFTYLLEVQDPWDPWVHVTRRAKMSRHYRNPGV